MTFDVAFDLMNIYRRFPYYIHKPSMVPIRLFFFKWDQFHIFSHTTWPQMTFDLDMTSDLMEIWMFPHYINKQSLVPLVLNFSNEVNFTFLAHHWTWPHMTFDLGIWTLTAWAYKGSHILSINQVWFQLNFNFSNDATHIFSPSYNWHQMTFDLEIWPLTSSTNEGFHVASTCMTQLWLKSIKACGR